MAERGATLPIWTGKIEGLTQEGVGVGTIEVSQGGKVLHRPIFVPYTTPGDTVKAEIVGQRGKYNFGELKEVLEPSPDRIEPRCPHYGVCGGCNLQHVKYEEQLAQKARQITYLMQRKGVKLPGEVKVWPSRKMHKYRWRCRIAVQFKDGKVSAGFRKHRSREIVKVETCFIVAGQIRELIGIINETELEVPDSEIEITAVVGEKKKIGILLHMNDLPEEISFPIRTFFTDVYARNRQLIGNLFFEQDGKTKTVGQVQEHITYTADDLTFMFLPETFIQSNVLTNQLLVKKAMELLEPEKKDVIVDLYAGIGNFSLPAAKRCSQVIAVERHDAAIQAGQTNALSNGLDNVLFVNRTSERYLHEYNQKRTKEKKEYPKASKIIIDPARLGCSEKVLKELLKSGVERILYISCSPVTLAKDLAFLQTGYSVSDVVGIDMFPDISHVETIVVLDKK